MSLNKAIFKIFKLWYLDSSFKHATLYISLHGLRRPYAIRLKGVYVSLKIIFIDQGKFLNLFFFE